MGSRETGFGTIALALAVAAPAAAQGADTVAIPATERVICRSSTATGSLLNRQNICLTARAWERGPSDRRDDEDFTQEEQLALRNPGPQEAIQTGTADWSSFPGLRMRGRLPYNQLVSTLAEIIRRGECTLPGQSAREFDVTVPFAVRTDATGRVTRVVVADTFSATCAPLSGLVGLTVLARARRGDIDPAAHGRAGWYSGAINLTLEQS